MLLRSMFVLVLLLAGSTGRAAPTTQPVKPGPDQVQIVDKTFGYSFNVPKVWRQVEQKGDRSIHIFHVPAPGAMNKAVSSWIVLVEQDQWAGDLSKYADHMRQSILERMKDAKIESDDAAPVVGVDGHEIIYTMKMKVKITTRTGKQQMDETEDVPAKVRCSLFLYNGAAYQFVLTSDVAGYPTRARAADIMLKSFALKPAE